MLAPGRDLSHYRIVDRIGEGGMGVVWRATDTTLARDVAIKVLPDLFASDPERLARFEREAKLLASLNHPHIAAIYGLHSAEGLRFLTMELVEGEDLAQRLARGPMPIPEAIAVAHQVAQALEHAHERGVIHRDLKPGNVKLGPEGKAKVLDFGLAKALEGDAGRPAPSSVLSQSPTITGNTTAAQVLLGTAAYMAPEQARGYAVDKRADIWAFGVVLMEMLTGRRLFEGDTISDTLASVLKTEVDWSVLPKETPSPIRALLGRCLQRDARQRLRDIGEARIVLEDVIARPTEAPFAAPAGGSRVPVPAIALGALALGALATFGALRLAAPPRTQTALRKFHLALPAEERSAPQSPVVSPDGRTVAYVLGGAAWIQSLGELEPRRLKTERDPSHLFWSPDSRSIGYFSGTRILKSALDGSESQAICDVGGELLGGNGASWGGHGMIVFSRADSGGMYQVPAVGGDPKNLFRPDTTESDFHDPYVLPGGRGILFPAHRVHGAFNNITLWSGGKARTLIELPGQLLSSPCYDPAGYILFGRTPTTPGIWALPFSLSRLEVTGTPFLVAPGGSSPSVSTDGTLVHLTGGSQDARQLAWWSRDGKEQGAIGEPGQSPGNPSLSPDGRRIAWPIIDNNNRDIWILDTARGTRTRLTFDPGADDFPSWSPAGDRIAYTTLPQGASAPDGLRAVVRAADGTGPVDTVAVGVAPSITPDGDRIGWVSFARGGLTWNWMEASLAGPRQPRMLLPGNPRVLAARVSPAGDLMAYMSAESGQWEIYLTRYASCEGRWQVSTAGGQWPHWNAKGDRLAFVQADDIMEVEVSGKGVPVLSTPKLLFTRPSLGPGAFGLAAGFDMTRDGSRFLIVRPAGQQGPVQGVAVVQSWVAEFADRKTAER